MEINIQEKRIVHQVGYLQGLYRGVQSAKHKIPHFTLNLKVHYHVHRSSPVVFVLNQMNPVHTLPSYFFMLHFNIILPFRPQSSKWLFFQLSSPKPCMHFPHVQGQSKKIPNFFFFNYCCTYNLIRLVSFKVLPSTVDTPLPAFFPVLERVLRDGVKVL